MTQNQKQGMVFEASFLRKSKTRYKIEVLKACMDLAQNKTSCDKASDENNDVKHGI